MKRLLALYCILLAAMAASARAQVVPAATARQFSISAGGTVSVFQPDFAGTWAPPAYTYPVPEASTYPLIGVGAFVDVRFTHWIQFEVEGRWQRFNEYQKIFEDNYLAGPRVPIRRIGKMNIYGKALGGYSKMNFEDFGHGRFTTIAFGGGADIKMSRKISLRAFDFEYQYWPKWGNAKLSPYGVSAGVSYKIF